MLTVVMSLSWIVILFFSSELDCIFTFMFTTLYSENNILLFKTYLYLRNGIYICLLLEKI